APVEPVRGVSAARKPVRTRRRTWCSTVAGSFPNRSASCLLVIDSCRHSRRIRRRSAFAMALNSSGVASRLFTGRRRLTAARIIDWRVLPGERMHARSSGSYSSPPMRRRTRLVLTFFGALVALGGLAAAVAWGVWLRTDGPSASRAAADRLCERDYVE